MYDEETKKVGMVLVLVSQVVKGAATLISGFLTNVMADY